MLYYVKHTKDSEIEGPFSIEQVNQMVQQKRLTVKSVATIDSGQGLHAVQHTQPQQWVDIVIIPGYKPDPAEERKLLKTVALILIIIVVFTVIGIFKLAGVIRGIH